MAKFEHFWLKFGYVVLCGSSEGIKNFFFQNQKFLICCFFQRQKQVLGFFRHPPEFFFKLGVPMERTGREKSKNREPSLPSTFLAQDMGIFRGKTPEFQNNP